MQKTEKRNLMAALRSKIVEQEHEIAALRECISALEKVAEAGVKLKAFHIAFADNNEMVFYTRAARDAFDEHTKALWAAGYDITKEHIL